MRVVKSFFFFVVVVVFFASVTKQEQRRPTSSLSLSLSLSPFSFLLLPPFLVCVAEHAQRRKDEKAFRSRIFFRNEGW